jgi:hypothetical protein
MEYSKKYGGRERGTENERHRVLVRQRRRGKRNTKTDVNENRF